MVLLELVQKAQAQAHVIPLRLYLKLCNVGVVPLVCLILLVICVGLRHLALVALFSARNY